jgi:CelD/BcsL family acetyltransferase involved in cellulose biosynthesis
MDDIDLVSGAEAIARLGPLWQAAGAQPGAAGPFDAFDLVRAASETTARQGSAPLVAVVRTNGNASTLLPLRSERLMGARIAVPLLHPLAQYATVIGAPLSRDALGRLGEALCQAGFDVLLLRRVRADGGLHEALTAAGRPQGAAETALFVDLAAFGTFAAYDASFSGSTRRNRRQRRQKLEALAGPLTFSVRRGADALADLETGIGWKRAWLAARGLSSPVLDRGPWEHLLRETVASGAALVSALRAGPSLAAVEVGYASGADYMAYLGAFDPALAAFSPGQEQMLRTIAWCFEARFQRYDLLAPADDYKRQWARTETGVVLDDYAVALTPVGHGVAELRRHVRPLARELYHRLSPEARVAGGRYGMPAAAAAAAMCAGAVIAAIE